MLLTVHLLVTITSEESHVCRLLKPVRSLFNQTESCAVRSLTLLHTAAHTLYNIILLMIHKTAFKDGVKW